MISLSFLEASLFGYHPVDLLERKSIVDQQVGYLKRLSREVPKGVAILVGAIVPNTTKKVKPSGMPPFHRTRKEVASPKQLLPTYDVFDESRHIQPGYVQIFLKYKGHRILVTICEDIWALADQGRSRNTAATA